MPELQRLAARHAPALLHFEQENRAYFARSAPDRGDDYFAEFAAGSASATDSRRLIVSGLRPASHRKCQRATSKAKAAKHRPAPTCTHHSPSGCPNVADGELTESRTGSIGHRLTSG